MGHRIPRGRALLGAAIYGLLAFGGAFAFAFYALVELEAGFGQILLSIVPLLTLFLAVGQRLEKLTTAAVVGGLLAFVGVIVMSGLTLDSGIPVLSVLAALGSALCFAQASITIKRFPESDPVVVNAVGMTFGALFLFGLTLATATTIEMPRLADTWWAMAYMVVIGSGLVFTLYVWVLERWDASRANYGFVVIPIATLLISAWLTGEEITAGLTWRRSTRSSRRLLPGRCGRCNRVTMEQKPGPRRRRAAKSINRRPTGAPPNRVAPSRGSHN